MMRQTFSILIMFLISINGFAQCDDIDKLELGGTYSSRTRNYIPFEIKQKDKIEKDDTFYPFDIKKIEKYSDFILLKAEKYIVTRANIDFYNKLKIVQFQVNYHDSTKADYGNEHLYNLSNYSVTYWILFTYKNNGFGFAFGLEFDKEGKMVSENQFPDFSLNPEFEKLNEPCLALQKVKSDERFKGKKVDFIELSYLDEINSFCWLVQEDYNVNEKQDIELETWYEYSEQSFYVNVNSNEIEKIEDEKSRVIYCGSKLGKESKD